MNIEANNIRRGDIFYYQESEENFEEGIQCGSRPVIILSNNIGNSHSSTVIVTFLTSQLEKKYLPTHVAINSAKKPSIALLEQIRTISKSSLSEYVNHITKEEELKIDKALSISLGSDAKLKAMPDDELLELISNRRYCNLHERHKINTVVKSVTEINQYHATLNEYVDSMLTQHLDPEAISRIKNIINQELQSKRKRYIQTGNRILANKCVEKKQSNRINISTQSEPSGRSGGLKEMSKKSKVTKTIQKPRKKTDAKNNNITTNYNNNHPKCANYI